MTFSIWMSMTLALLLPLAAPLVARVAAPALAALSLTVLAVVSTVALLWGLLLVSVSLFLHDVLAHDPVPRPVAVVAIPVALGALFLVTRSLVRQLAFLREVDATLAADAAACPDGGVLLVDGEVHAHAVAGLRRGRVEVGADLLNALPAAERAAMLAHERAHLRWHHGLLRSAAQVAASVNPGLARVPVLLSVVCERWADESAARTVNDRAAVARALSRAALVTVRRPQPQGAVPFGVTDVSDRVESLLAAEPARRRGAFLVLALWVGLAFAFWGACDGTWDTFRNLFLR